MRCRCLYFTEQGFVGPLLGPEYSRHFLSLSVYTAFLGETLQLLLYQWHHIMCVCPCHLLSVPLCSILPNKVFFPLSKWGLNDWGDTMLTFHLFIVDSALALCSFWVILDLFSFCWHSISQNNQWSARLFPSQCFFLLCLYDNVDINIIFFFFFCGERIVKLSLS